MSAGVVCGFVVSRLKRCTLKLRATVAPPWAEQEQLDIDPTKPPPGIPSSGKIAHPKRPNGWLEIVHVPTQRVVLRSTQRTAARLRSVLAPGERLVLARRGGTGAGLRTPTRWWM